ncbi:membrane-spanning 4-domains subfamily A member 15-like isoform X2 [Salarias fasciatus]|uniref:membrane-spanning 4-domains subfamily A member 15-like isoform X2 n=1 Tax=Salarias fasciatus TaxID=181472 RepID=UPI001176746A|nr:membrane-spanning 4-domains subfamily A member 15-like isoform X2 [Salarias fasciatus]
MDSSTVSYNPGNAVMVTPVLPDAPNGEQQPSLDRRHNFRKGHPKALGIVQIMTGALMLLSGIAMAFYQPSVEVATRFIVGGALIYITSGAVTVAAEKFLSHCLINTSLAFNIIAAMAAAAAAIMYAFGLVFMSLFSVFSSQDPQVIVQAVEGPNSTQPPPYYQTSVAPTHPYPEVAPNVKNQGDLGSAEPPPYQPN